MRPGGLGRGPSEGRLVGKLERLLRPHRAARRRKLSTKQ